ncbi:hypothetical protein LguiA_032137 [Lonicera macranthoides]
MGLFKRPLFLILLLVISFLFDKARVAEARPLPQQRYSKIFATMGVVCKCCDGEGGECKSTWVEPCSKLQCLPWKQH